MNINYNNIKRSLQSAVIALLIASCSNDSVDSFRYVAPGWEDTVNYTISEVASSGFDFNGEANWVIIDSELSTSSSDYDAFMNEVNKYNDVSLSFVNVKSVADNYFHGFNTITKLEFGAANTFGIAVFEGLPLTSLIFRANGDYSGPKSSFNLMFNGFENSESCHLMLGVDEFLNVNSNTWGGMTWLSIVDVVGNEARPQPSEHTQYSIDEMAYNTPYSTDEIWQITDTEISDEQYEKLNNIINYHDEGSVWLSLPNIDAIPDNAFKDCVGLYSVEFEDNATVGEGSFYGCSSLVVVQNSENVASFGASSFAKCSSLCSIDISGTTEIAESMFSSCTALVQVTLKPEIDVRSTTTEPTLTVGDSAFKGCTALTTIENVGNVVSFGTYAFSGCTSLNTIELSVATLSNFIFTDCSSLQSVTLPNCINIGKSPFTRCTSLTELNLTSDSAITTNVDYANNFDPSQCTLTLGAAEVAMMKVKGVWHDDTWLKILDVNGDEALPQPSVLPPYYIDDMVLNTTYSTDEIWQISDTEISDEQYEKLRTIINFQGAGSVRISLPNIDVIPDNAFSGCTALAQVTLKPADATTTTPTLTVGGSAFKGCTALTTIENVGNVASFGSYAFSGCTSLYTIELSVATLSNFIFNNCSNLQIVTLPNCINIGKSPFTGCASLTELKLTSDSAISTNVDYANNFDPSQCTLTLGAAEVDMIRAKGVWHDGTWLKILDGSGNEVIPEAQGELKPDVGSSSGGGSM
ncbi:MAG: leucine-rich repeat domain-containing protein [Rikenellaceae bacterium]